VLGVRRPGPGQEVTGVRLALQGVVSAGALSEAGAVTSRILPVLVFLVAVTVLAELAQAAQVFDVAAALAARAGRGRTPLLFAFLLGLGVVTTVVLSLDTTAVLLTPVMLATAHRLALDPVPFAFAAVWTANVASLLLPVSNLTNLLAVDRLGLTTPEYVAATARPALAAIAVMALVLAGLYRRHLTGRYPVPPPLVPRDRVLFAGTTAACLLLVPALLAGVPVAWAALAAAGGAAGFTRWRSPTTLSWALLPWRLVLGVWALFLLVSAVGPHGLDTVLRGGIGSPLQTAFVSAGGANLANNLPAYLAMESVAPHDQLLAVLLGVNLGPLILPWGSLATLLWAQRCRALGVRVSWVRFALAGSALVPLLLLCTVPLL
jgi:arsenical pump membrane protein